MRRKTLVAAREKKGWDQQLLADHVYPQVSRTTVSNWERALKTPRAYYKRELCRVFGFDDPEILLQIDYTDEETYKTQGTSTATSLQDPVSLLPETIYYEYLDGNASSSTLEAQDLVSALPEEELHESILADPESSPGDAASSDQSLLDTATPTDVLSSSNLVRLYTSTLRQFIVSDPTRRFWQIANTDYATPLDMKAAIQGAIKEMNMITGDSMTRREALRELASIPMISLGQKFTLHSRRYEELLRYCAAALEGCWELYRGSDSTGTRHAFKCVCIYVPMLENIANNSARYRNVALDLATQYALLQTLLGWGNLGTIATVPLAQKAHALSCETDNILLQISASSKLGWAYSAAHKSAKALETMQRGACLLREYQRKKNGLLVPSHVIGSFNSTYALVQAKNGCCSDSALGVATDCDTHDKHTLFTIFTKSAQYLEAAHTCVAKGAPKQALIWIGKRIDLETLAPLPDVPQSKRGLIETINILTRTLLQGAERDMKRIAATWQVGMEGAQALKDETRYQEAMTNFEIMRALWPGEKAITELVPLTSHW